MPLIVRRQTDQRVVVIGDISLDEPVLVVRCQNQSRRHSFAAVHSEVTILGREVIEGEQYFCVGLVGRHYPQNGRSRSSGTLPCMYWICLF